MRDNGSAVPRGAFSRRGTAEKEGLPEVLYGKGTYLEDRIPWICGYSGGKDSSATVQLVWMALREIPPEKRVKTVHVISTDTMVESPVVALWAKKSLKRMKEGAEREMLPIVPHRLTPATEDTFWVNLIGRGFAFPRVNFRWCTDRLKIGTSNRFIREILAAESEAILVLGSRKAACRGLGGLHGLAVPDAA